MPLNAEDDAAPPLMRSCPLRRPRSRVAAQPTRRKDSKENMIESESLELEADDLEFGEVN